MTRALTINQAAQTLGVSRATIYRRIEDGSLRSVKFGGRRLIPETEIDRVLATTPA